MLTKQMNFRSVLLLVLVPHSISFGRCQDVSLSVCWMSRDDALRGPDVNVWLNNVSLKSIGGVGKVSSLTLHPAADHNLTLQHRGSVQTWTVTITPRTKSIKVRGRQKPSERPSNATKNFLSSLGPAEVFACENGTLFFHQDDDLLLATGHTARHPVTLASRSASMLLLSWTSPSAGPRGHAVTLYHVELDSYVALGGDTTARNHHRFTALEPCSPYVACVGVGGARSFACLSAITDPDVPRDLEVTSWNSSSMTLAWSCPENRRYSLFLLTVFYLNGTDDIVAEERVWHRGDSLAHALSDLQPCSRVSLGLQTVCLSGPESRYSRMVLNDGNSVHSKIEALRQTSSGPDSYTLSWTAGNRSSVSAFRVYHDGVPQGTTLLTSHTVAGLPPCGAFRARVEALCGESVLMSAKTVAAHTGPRGVSELRFHSNTTTATWLPGTTRQESAVAFLYELTAENGSAVQSGRVTDPELRLAGLEEGATYLLDVWEQCDGQWESERSTLSIGGGSSPPVPPGRALELQSDFSTAGLTLVLPWSLPGELQDDESEPRARVEQAIKDKLQELLRDSDDPPRVELVAVVPASEPDATEVLFVAFDASQTEGDVPLPAQEQLEYIRSRNWTDVAVSNGLLLWNGPDLCAAAAPAAVCPVRSLCVNTLGSYACVCQHGFYDVSAAMEPAVTRPVCKEKGLFSQCVDRLMTGGVAKPFLMSHVGGKVELKLNDGRCSVDERGDLYYFHVSRKASECGTERRVNGTHIVFQNTLSVSSSREQRISRRGLNVVWRCAYPRHHVRKAHVSVKEEGLTSFALVELNSSLQLAPTMALYRDGAYAQRYRDAAHLGPDDALFFLVALQANGTFAPNVLLQVVSCWATESSDPRDAVQGVLLQDGCPVDDTFRWLSVNGLAQSSRFSVKMFRMPKELPLYFHCLTNVCGPEENCAKNCNVERRAKRSAKRGNRGAVVSAGPLVVRKRVESRGGQTSWTEAMTVVFVVAGSVGILGVAVLSLGASKAIMSYRERPRRQ